MFSGTGILEVIINAGLTIAQLLAQSSYIGTSIIMMVIMMMIMFWHTHFFLQIMHLTALDLLIGSILYEIIKALGKYDLPQRC